MSRQRRLTLLTALGPGLLVAATGVGAGDLATGAFSGSALGASVLWAVLVGALLKYVLSEGLARYQLASGETLLEGALTRAPFGLRWLFLLYLLPWSWFTGAALVGACGVTAHSSWPVFGDATTGKLVWGALHSLVGLVLVWRGGYRVFERLMGLAIGVMFVTVVWTVAVLGFETDEVLRGLLIPSLGASREELTWTVALVGGVGGTLTLLCYGYWIREEGRDAPADLALCRIDLGVGFTVTAIFGVAMVLIGSRIDTDGKGSTLIVKLADELGRELGPGARWAFLAGAWGAVFSSLLGVWQAVPYVFADFWRLRRARPGEEHAPVDTRSRAYRGYMLALALVPLFGLTTSFKEAQKAYAVIGACFLPLLALSILWLGRRAIVGDALRNRAPSVVALALTLAFFVLAGVLRIAG
jgi:Mn2+/Fe2+ NRAMP family transporter